MNNEDINVTGTAYWYKQIDDKKYDENIKMLNFLTLSWYITVSTRNKKIKLTDIEVVEDEHFHLILHIEGNLLRLKRFMICCNHM